ncbi:helix-turn-helix domain-containing protein [Streptomyces pratensis]|uniref:helix-turn-helix domain-containing protein n=1 Tax=Streptomyces pratensis TaxID=1169025 RepID=UPI003018ABC6
MEPDGGAELAAALRGLKERTPHSYESLAARLGVSRSALHRYCSGKSVPADFATVERFAKRCGARRAELMDLHRLWALATEPEPEAAPAPAPDRASLPPTGTADRPLRRVGRLTGAAAAAVLAGAVLLAGARGGTGTAGGGRLLLSAVCEGPIGLGQQGGCVRETQRLLAEAGAAIDRDGRFAADTRRRVLAFQALAGLRVNGVVDEATKRALHLRGASLAAWDEAQVADRIREVFDQAPEQAVRVADCQSRLDPLHVVSDSASTRTWGVFQLSEARLRTVDATPGDALDPEWNIRFAHRLWSLSGGFHAWPDCLLPPEPGPEPEPRS